MILEDLFKLLVRLHDENLVQEAYIKTSVCNTLVTSEYGYLEALNRAESQDAQLVIKTYISMRPERPISVSQISGFNSNKNSITIDFKNGLSRSINLK